MPNTNKRFHNLLPKDGKVYFFPNFILNQEQLFFSIQNSIVWKHEPIKLFGKTIPQPRLTAWMGDQGKAYTYSGITMYPSPWTDELLTIKNDIEQFSQANFNSALLNYYRDGSDSVGWHQDNEKQLGKNPTIGSVSLGTPRIFRMQHVKDKQSKLSIHLTPGSVLLMQGKTQHYWRHCVPKQKNCAQARINITFRKVN